MMGVSEDSEPMPCLELEPEDLVPQGPWAFFRKAMEGGWSLATAWFVLAWVLLQSLTSLLWARHLIARSGHSAAPNYWGELLELRDVWEMLEHGGLQAAPLGTSTSLAFFLAFLGMLWAGWNLQARSVGLSPRLGPWFWGLLDALLLGALPLFLLGRVLSSLLEGMASTGIQGLGWLDFVGQPLLKLSLTSVLMVQWWLCRLNRAAATKQGWRLGGWGELGRHLGHSFLRVWLYSAQWCVLVVGGSLLRGGLFLLVILLAWRWGGGTPGKVWGLAIALVGATVLNAWLLAWFLRLSAGFLVHDRRVREAVRDLLIKATA